MDFARGNGFPVETPPMRPRDGRLGQSTDGLLFLDERFRTSRSKPICQLLDNVGRCFETVAAALAFVRVELEEHPGNQKVMERSLPLVSEAQSALRAAVQRLGAPDEPDQLAVFEWLKVTAARHHVYIKNFMRADELADPTHWSHLLGRIESLAASGQLSRQQSSQIERVRDRLRRLQGNEGNDQDWLAIINAVDEIVGDGVPPSNRELRELLLPVIDELPDRERVTKRLVRLCPPSGRPVLGDPFIADQVAGPARSVR